MHFHATACSVTSWSNLESSLSSATAQTFRVSSILPLRHHHRKPWETKKKTRKNSINKTDRWTLSGSRSVRSVTKWKERGNGESGSVHHWILSRAGTNYWNYRVWSSAVWVSLGFSGFLWASLGFSGLQAHSATCWLFMSAASATMPGWSSMWH